MIYIDDRIGSRELTPYFSPYGVDVESTRLDAGDFCFYGHGEQEECLVGVERKRLSDLIQSMRDRRLSGAQLPKLLAQYGYVYLIVEGVWRPGRTGILEVLKGKGWAAYGSGQGRKPIMYAEVDNYLNSLGLRAGVRVKRSNGEQETAAQVVNLYKHFQKEWGKHTAHSQVYAPVPEPKKAGWRVEVWTQEEEQLRAFAAQIPGIDRKCDAIARKFGRTSNFLAAREKALMEVEGIGKELARRIREVFTE